MFVGFAQMRNERWPVGFRTTEQLVGAVKAFIDITGASGAVYRFAAIENSAEAPPVAGAFVFARIGKDGVDVVCCGLALNLKDRVGLWGAQIQRTEAEGIFVRLNVSRSVREREHVDIVKKHRPELVATDGDEQ